MTSNDLCTYLTQYLNRRVRVGSALTSTSWRVARGRVSSTMAYAIPSRSTRVWCRFDNGVSVEVDDDGLTVELPPATGTYDFATARDQMEAIGTAIRRYGPTQAVLAKRCKCPTCLANYVVEDAKVQAEFKDAWNHGVTDAELELDGW